MCNLPGVFVLGYHADGGKEWVLRVVVFISILIGAICNAAPEALPNVGVQVKIQEGGLGFSLAMAGREFYRSPKNDVFFTAAEIVPHIAESKGHYEISEDFERRCRPKSLALRPGKDPVIVGDLVDEDGQDCGGYKLTLKTDGSTYRVPFAIEVANPNLNYLKLSFQSHKDEAFFGFGLQATHLNLKGHRVPILVQEQGIGRGEAPFFLSLVLDYLDVTGSEYHSYIAAPYFITSDSRGLYLENTEYAVADLVAPEKAHLALHSGRMQGAFLVADRPLELLETYTQYAGRMAPLPEWIGRGAVLGLQGGNGKVESVVSQLLNFGVPISGVWIQDWVGKRETIVGKQLWWNWVVDERTYDLPKLLTFLNQRNIRLLGYVNPMLVDVPFGEEGAQTTKVRPSFYQLFRDKRYLVEKQEIAGQPPGVFFVENTDFEAGLVDLTNRSAQETLKEVIKSNMIGAGMSGWMADYAENLPFAGKFSKNIDGAKLHNAYPVLWAKLNHEAAAETKNGSDIVFFTRSGYTQSPKYSRLFWLGDQTVTWGRQDGLYSSLVGLISGGLSGFSINHSDIGGYATSSLFGMVRDDELLMRWMELNAYTAVFRTHEGNQPEANVQVYSKDAIAKHFKKFAEIYASLEPYRQKLYKQAASKGYPVVRHIFLHYPKQTEFHGVDSQFLLGSDLLVAPVLESGGQRRSVLLPGGEVWVDVYTKKEIPVIQVAETDVSTPLGSPAVFFRKGGDSSLQAYLKLIEQQHQ